MLSHPHWECMVRQCVRCRPYTACSSRRVHCVAAKEWRGDGSAPWQRLACGFVGSSPCGRGYAGGKISTCCLVVICIHKPYVVSHWTATSSAKWTRCRSPFSLVCGQLLTMWSPACHLLHDSNFGGQYVHWPWLVYIIYSNANNEPSSKTECQRVHVNSSLNWWTHAWIRLLIKSSTFKSTSSLPKSSASKSKSPTQVQKMQTTAHILIKWNCAFESDLSPGLKSQVLQVCHVPTFLSVHQSVSISNIYCTLYFEGNMFPINGSQEIR